jgi:hypothetical protein
MTYGEAAYKKDYEEWENQSNAFSDKNWWWIFVLNNKGHWVNVGKRKDENEANAYANSKCSTGMYQVCSFPTGQVAQAQRFFKAWLLNHGHDIDESTGLISRKPALESAKHDDGFGMML